MNSETIDSLNIILSYIFLSLALLLELFVLIRVRLRLDPSMLIVLALYLIQFTLWLPYFSGNGKGVRSFTFLAFALIIAA